MSPPQLPTFGTVPILPHTFQIVLRLSRPRTWTFAASSFILGYMLAGGSSLFQMALGLAVAGLVIRRVRPIVSQRRRCDGFRQSPESHIPTPHLLHVHIRNCEEPPRLFGRQESRHKDIRNNLSQPSERGAVQRHPRIHTIHSPDCVHRSGVPHSNLPCRPRNGTNLCDHLLPNAESEIFTRA